MPYQNTMLSSSSSIEFIAVQTGVLYAGRFIVHNVTEASKMF